MVKSTLAKEEAMRQPPPNIVFILIDDMGWRDLGCTGSPFYETPHLDHLAAEGMRFTNAYASCPVCSPTRASLLTGKYPATVGITNYIPGTETGKLLPVPYLHHLPLEEKTIARTLRDEAGYRTFHVGKWHLGGPEFYPTHHGFDVNVAGCDWGHPRNGYFSPYGIPDFPDGPPGEYLTDRLTDEAIRLLQQAEDAPFFLNLCHYSVHTPLQAKPDDIRRFEEKAAALGLDTLPAFAVGETFPCDHLKDKRVTRRLLQSDPVYAAMIFNLDENVGRLLQALQETGKANNTLVVFTSDNGGLSSSEGSPTCNAPLAEGKGWMYDGGVRVPLLVRWPGVVKAGAVCGTPMTSPDFYPTFAEVGGINEPQETEGVSLLPLLTGQDIGGERALFWHYPHYGNQGGTPGSSVRIGDWKLIEFFEDNRLELYNLQSDEGEDHNLVSQEQERAAQMQTLLAGWRKSVAAQIPEWNPGHTSGSG